MNYIRGNDPRLLILQSKYPLCQKVEQSTETQDKHLEETADLLESPFYSSHMHHFHQDSLLQTRINITNLRQRDYSCKRNYSQALCSQDQVFSWPTARHNPDNIKPCKTTANSTNLLDKINTTARKVQSLQTYF